METIDLAAIDSAGMSAGNQCRLALVSNFAPGGPLWGEPLVSCQTRQGTVSVQLTVVNDPRALTVGRHELTPEQAGLVVKTSKVCDLVIPLGTTTIDVTRADGAAAPYPTIVTSDYAREFTVHLESTHDNGCTSETVVLDLQVQQSRSDYFYDPTTRCLCL